LHPGPHEQRFSANDPARPRVGLRGFESSYPKIDEIVSPLRNTGQGSDPSTFNRLMLNRPSANEKNNDNRGRSGNGRAHDGGLLYASLALASGKSVRWVADQLGHASPTLTLKTYAHSIREEEADLSFADFASENVAKRLRLPRKSAQRKTPPT
jgi:integrase